ncbi:hypothetical protein [Caldicellulosiruptor acetigenus]|uniref:hypothetical protein n=1 Tax=Caldicellulosiruptor acetigenus TaxID=301953 RepID=UPI00031E7396|nr:hypothetical protein [Caldicellulosiruptor acetigenus]
MQQKNQIYSLIAGSSQTLEGLLCRGLSTRTGSRTEKEIVNDYTGLRQKKSY